MKLGAAGDVIEGSAITWRSVAVIAFLAALFAFIVAEVTTGGGVVGWDQQITDLVIATRGSMRSRGLWVFTLLGNTPVLAVITLAAVGLFLTWGRTTPALRVAIGVLSAEGVSELAKALLQRDRPPEAIALIPAPASHSLPSGHALVTAVLLGVLLVPLLSTDRWGLKVKLAACSAAVVVGGFIGISRVYLGVHWTSDVIGGWCLAGIWLVVVLAVFRAWERRRKVQSGSRLGGPKRWQIVLTALLSAAPVIAVVLEAWARPLTA